ncbi:MMPL family transporter [Luedemannella flava]|uniref:MMPL family transporter n=1 Tax=Luedemannella flava TaxID=349316 RepID=A0ABN2MKK5_9ACTN
MFAWWGRCVVRFRWAVLVATVALIGVGATWGAAVFGSLTGGGFNDTNSPSAKAQERIVALWGRQDTDVLVLYRSSTLTVDQDGFQKPITDLVTTLRARPEVANVNSPYEPVGQALVAPDWHSLGVSIRLKATPSDPDAQAEALARIEPLLAVQGLEHEVGGLVPFVRDANEQVENDVTRAEVISLPILFVLMILIFRGLIAALTPILVGVVSILGALTVTRVLTNFTDVSVFAVNVITMIGLGMGIDYALFVVSRFREELAAGRTTAEAVERTLATAGRTVAVSGLVVTLALSGLVAFPLGFLRSMAYGGMAAVAVAMLAALTALPALLAVLGPRIDLVRVPLPRLRVGASSKSDDGGWARLARSVMNKPVRYALFVVVILVLLALPFSRAKFGGFDERTLPEGTPSRNVAERLITEFPNANVAPVLVVLENHASAADVTSFFDRIRAVPGVATSMIVKSDDRNTLIAVKLTAEASSEQARETALALRAVAPPPGATSSVTGRPTYDADQLASLGDRLPWMGLYVMVATFMLLFLAFGSLILPLKAILMNVISIGASFGVVVWIFQDGHLADLLGFTPTGYLEPTNLILMLALLFGLSTDYEVFLLSRVREEWDATGDNRLSVARGLQRTGGIITAAALLLIIVVAGFATGGAATIKMLGIGTVVAVAVDAALVRTLLVPALMRLLGDWNWWAPGPLAGVYRRYGISEAETPAVPKQRAGARPRPGARTRS